MVKTLAFTGIIFLVIAGVVAFASNRHRPLESHADWVKKKIASELNLNDSQKTHLESIANELIEKGNTMRSEHESVRKTIFEEVGKEKIDSRIFNEMISSKTDQAKELAFLFVKHFDAFHQTLSSGQRIQLVALMEKHHERKARFHDRPWKK